MWKPEERKLDVKPIKIINKKDCSTKRFDSLRNRVVFLDKNEKVFIKTTQFTYGELVLNALDLETGDHARFYSDELVTPLSSEIIIK